MSRKAVGNGFHYLLRAIHYLNLNAISRQATVRPDVAHCSQTGKNHVNFALPKRYGNHTKPSFWDIPESGLIKWPKAP